MSSKETILNQIRENRPKGGTQFSGFDFSPYPNGIDDFKATLEKVGGKLVLKRDIKDLHTWIKKEYGSDNYVFTEVDSIVGNYTLNEMSITNEKLNKIHVAVLAGSMGIAENGAVWLERFLHRSIPFITQHLVIFLSSDAIVGTMHEAYQIINKKELPSFGIFISGPSKTADIEQSLIYGAHGPRSLTVIVE